MEIAKGTDLPDLLSHLGYQARRVGQYHTTREMDSHRVKERRTWKRYSNGKGGDAITFLQEFCGKDFREAVKYLLEFNGNRARDSPAPRPRPVQPEEKPAFVLPIPNQGQWRVFAYLQKRGIAPQVIRGFRGQPAPQLRLHGSGRQRQGGSQPPHPAQPQAVGDSLKWLRTCRSG